MFETDANVCFYISQRDNLKKKRLAKQEFYKTTFTHDEHLLNFRIQEIGT